MPRQQAKDNYGRLLWIITMKSGAKSYASGNDKKFIIDGANEDADFITKKDCYDQVKNIKPVLKKLTL